MRFNPIEEALRFFSNSFENLSQITFSSPAFIFGSGCGAVMLCCCLCAIRRRCTSTNSSRIPAAETQDEKDVKLDIRNPAIIWQNPAREQSPSPITPVLERRPNPTFWSKSEIPPTSTKSNLTTSSSAPTLSDIRRRTSYFESPR